MGLEIRLLSTSDSDFKERLEELLARGSEFDPAVDATVSGIIKDVIERGDAALIELTQKFDRNPASTMAELDISLDDCKDACDRISPELLESLECAYHRITQFHERQRQETASWSYDDEHGSAYGQRISPIERVGIYVPGGLAAYPSSVFMAAVPAAVAGVLEINMVVPAPEGKIKDSVLAAAYIAGVGRVMTIGGAQAIAALAYGTESIPKVDKIVGPGNAWVSAAKRQVFGQVGIDLIAGPSEVVVACDDSTNAEWAAADMFAQAEHDEDAQSVLISLSQEKIDEVRDIMSAMLPKMERKDIISRSLARQGAMICVRDTKELTDVINRIAPEHLGLMVEDPDSLTESVHHAGAIFIGPYSTEVFGDYCAGPNHVLPTSGAARFSSPLGVYDFMKRTSIMKCTPQGARELVQTASVMAKEERLTAHAYAAEIRKS